METSAYWEVFLPTKMSTMWEQKLFSICNLKTFLMEYGLCVLYHINSLLHKQLPETGYKMAVPDNY